MPYICTFKELVIILQKIFFFRWNARIRPRQYSCFWHKHQNTDQIFAVNSCVMRIPGMLFWAERYTLSSIYSSKIRPSAIAYYPNRRGIYLAIFDSMNHDVSSVSPVLIINHPQTQYESQGSLFQLRIFLTCAMCTLDENSDTISVETGRLSRVSLD